MLAWGCGPIVMLPGGRLAGDVRPVPTDWSFSETIETIQLETRPEEPYSVNLWGVAAGGDFYVMSGDAANRWAGHIAADPDVRLKVCEDVYEMRAVEVSDESVRQSVLAAVQAKYEGFEPTDERVAGATLYRLDPR